MERLEDMNAGLRQAVEDRVSGRKRPIIAVAGWIESGKSEAAGFLPGLAAHFQWADPIYASLATMLGVPESLLRDRKSKDVEITLPGGIVTSPRRLLETLGTEWGRDLIHPDLWVSLTLLRVERLGPGTGPVAVCGTRFPNEVAAARKSGGELWWVMRPGVEGPKTTHVSGRLLGPEDADQIVNNDGDLDDLRRAVEAAYKRFQATRREVRTGIMQ